MMDFYHQVGTMAIGSRLRRLSEAFTENGKLTFDLYQVPLDPKWFPVFYVLSHHPDGLSTGEIAEVIGHSHASVSQTVKAMAGRGLADSSRSEADGRVNVITLTDRGRDLLPRLREAYVDVREAVDELLAESSVDLWQALDEIERLLAVRSLYDRVKPRYQRRRAEETVIDDFRPEDASVFRELNLEWIKRYFEVEPVDLEYLEDPEATIIRPGGAVLMARHGGATVGTVALIRRTAERFELAKMAVSPDARGKGIGWRLGQATLERGRELGARTVYLESNTVLEPAIALYRKLGFREVASGTSPYDRCNIQMEVELVP